MFDSFRLTIYFGIIYNLCLLTDESNSVILQAVKMAENELDCDSIIQRLLEGTY